VINQPDVVVYSTALCAPCELLKQHLSSRGVAFVVKDPMMDEDAAEFLEERDIMTTPVLSVGGELVIGYNSEAVDALLAASHPG
jgi:glutaredoxin-like protein NrdH